MIDKIITKISLLLVFLLSGAVSTAYAQKSSSAMGGMVRDEFGNPLVGVAIRSTNGDNQSVTQKDGTYSISVSDGSKQIVFSLLGYADKAVPFDKGETVDVQMKPDGHHGDQVIQMGYTSQKMKDVSGAVSIVTGDELRKSPVASLSQALTGRLTGLYLDEYQSEPTREKLYALSRGLGSNSYNLTPLVVIDGIPCSYNSNESYQYINANEIESITLLKDASTTALYGIQSANGVLVITTKRGQPGRTRVEGSFDQSFQQWITHPRIYQSWEYATMQRQAAINDGKTGNELPFSEEQIAKFKSGENRELYPNNDWYHMYMKDLTSQQRANVNVSGGNDNVHFFTSVSFLHQGSWFKTENDRYKSNPNFTWFNYRSNVDVKLNKYLSAYLNLGGNIRRERTPDNVTYSLYGIYQSLFTIPSTASGPLTPDGNVVVTPNNNYPAYGRLNRAGFTRTTVTNINSQVGLNLDMSFLTKGLSLSGVFAYQTNDNAYLTTTQSYEKYVRTDDWDVLEFTRTGIDQNSPLAVSKTSMDYYHLDGIAHLDYNRTFGKHSVSAMGYMFYQSLSQQYAQQNGSANNLNYKRMHAGFEATYGYDNRYLVKFDLGYSGSDQFARNHRFTSTPSVSGAWVASNEAFLRDSHWLTLLKLRASYGKTANDLLDSQRFSYMDDVRQVRGGAVAAYRYVLTEGLIGNPLFEPEVSKKQNYGIDLGFFNSLTISFDYFKERMDNMVVQPISRIPYYQGVPLGNYPKTNIGKFENKGFDLTVTYEKQINKDWHVYGFGTFTYADNKAIDVAESLKDANYVYRNRVEGFPMGTQFGYLTDGYFNTGEDLADAPEYTFGSPRLGDLKYVDLNKDGKISEADQVPLSTGWMPKIQYSFSGGFSYKSWDFSILFQGQGQCKSIKSGMGIYENGDGYTGVYGSRHENAWTFERLVAGDPISGPALSTGKSTSHQPNDYYLYDLAFLRLKNVMISYTLPAKISKAISAEKIRIYLSGQNLWTWDRMKSGDFGPESNFSDFQAYRTYNIGINVVF